MSSVVSVVDAIGVGVLGTGVLKESVGEGLGVP